MAKPSPSYSGTKELIALGRAIKKLRLELGFSQETLAFEAGIDRSYIGGIERGEHNLALVNLMKISQTLGITSSELLNRAKL
ncbi:helix-turn-helix transcriptional regulator [Polynucleobacter sp. AP-Nickl1-40-C4]|uniref:helix-turn-helix domain-containing protein n=1 Tax=Polynucleobacter sp. AP-Nickl1-40-C4 TaxID=3108275 RepID=UPI002B22CB19|nr:helix-turn-helix transcriptional regulator [Polynucleobacter sp. AP-Nickl1-40-C4]MEA9567532.1 helix-turn-helix transcriptional regulator [Polynucleobacter sp. AP-Nickl1-40-C4]